MSEHHVLFENGYLFGNLLLETIPRPTGTLGEILRYLSTLCHFMGGANFFVFLLPFIYFCYSKNLGVKLGIALLSTAFFNGLAKYLFESVRPFDLSDAILAVQSDLIKEESFGFPSGHSHVSILVWGLLFLEFKNKFFRAFAVFIIVFTPFSRMYAGVHYPGDVLGGFTMGLISLILIEYLFYKVPNFPYIELQEESKGKILRSFSLVIVAITLSSTLLAKGTTHQQISSLEQVLIGTGSIAGFFVGLLYLTILFPKVYEWETVTSAKDLLTRAGFLIPGLLLFYVGLGMLGKAYHIEDSLFRYFRYFITNLYIVLIAPLGWYHFTQKKISTDEHRGHR
ncbi:MAG: phosphatase PAP2 family protein [Leptospiraceae bacterium]|nr:phosphatase PAP2 family protein [Leptospiraceae bacterium]